MVPRNIINDNRIIYVDPNDVRGNVNDVPLTPDYTNFCIWCNLTVERTSRLKNQAGGTSENEIYAIAFDLTNADYKTNQVSFMQGKDARAYSFYTTDYTNIDYDDIKKRNIIEGLQVESVNVSFINYQTPQVTIKFIDIRGGGFFGREEATHNEFGKLSNLETDENQKKFDNFFSCFVSFPYPRFRLQIKGFYGRPVTFQLTCTNFNGNFNSTTGNFEITVQFIGYEYGILGDIPFDLLIAAPLTKFGSQYWNEHVADMANNGWALDKDATEAPYLLLNFYDNISTALQQRGNDNMGEFIQDDDSETAMTGLLEQIKMLNELNVYQSEIKELCKKIFSNYYVTEYSDKDENTLFIYGIKSAYEYNENINELTFKYNTYNNLYKEYKEKYEKGGPATSGEAVYNKNFSEFLDHQCKKGGEKDISNHSNRTSKGIIDSENPTSCSGVQVNQMFSNEQYTISDGMSKAIVQDLSLWNWALFGGTFNDGIPFAKYASAICLGTSPSDKLTDLQENYNAYTDKVNAFQNRKINDIVGFTPYIGRYFKVVMCHLETFVELFYKCADAIQLDIDGKLRTPAKLGIYNLTIQTDVPGDVYKQVPPFPSVYKKYTPNTKDNVALMTGKDIVSDAWIGDFKGETDWQEEDLVNDLYKAAMKISESRTYQAEINHIKTNLINSVFPIDCITSIPKYAYTSLDGAKFYAALRAEISLDFMQRGRNISNSLAYELGMLDGYFYISKCGNNEFIKRLYNITNLGNELYNTTVYCNEFVSYPDVRYYEFVKAHEGRHPVFVEEGENVKYKYMTNDTTNSIYIPLESANSVNGINGFAKYYEYNTGTDFVPKDQNSCNFLIGHPTSYSSYSDTAHFVIITNQDKVNSIIDVYNKLINGEASVGKKSSSEFGETIKKYSLVGEHGNQKWSSRNNLGLTNTHYYNSIYAEKVITDDTSGYQDKFCSYKEMDFLDKNFDKYKNESNIKQIFQNATPSLNEATNTGSGYDFTAALAYATSSIDMNKAVQAFSHIMY